MGLDISEKGFIFIIGMEKDALECGKMISYLVIYKESVNG